MKQVLKDISEFAYQAFKFQEMPTITKNVTSFKVGEDKKLFLELYRDDLLVYINLRLFRALPEKYLYALQLCHFSNHHEFPLQVGLASRDELILFTRMPSSEVNPNEIKRAFKFLFDLSLQVAAR